MFANRNLRDFGGLDLAFSKREFPVALYGTPTFNVRTYRQKLTIVFGCKKFSELGLYFYVCSICYPSV